MDSIWIATTGVLTLVLVILGILGLRRTPPKRRLFYEVHVIRMLRPRGNDIEIRLNGVVIDDPHYVSLTVTSASRADIPSASFNEGEPIQFVFDHTVQAISADAQPGDIDLQVVAEAVEVPRQLIKAGAMAQISFITAGRTRLLNLRNPLIDIPIVPFSNRPDTRWRWQRWANTAILAATALMGALAVFLGWK